MTQEHVGINRRTFLGAGTLGGLSLVAIASNLLWGGKQAQAGEIRSDRAALTPDAALQKLLEGNQRFSQHHPNYPDQSKARVEAVAQAQHPFATVLTCADSRVPVELLFDQGIGDIFDVRVAGNIVTPEVLGSIEYAAALLETPLLMVLGHERCGAVTAAVKHEELPGEIGTFVEAILPAVERVKNKPGDAVENAVTANVQYQIEQLERSPLLVERVQSGQLKIVGGRYDLDTGIVTIVT